MNKKLIQLSNKLFKIEFSKILKPYSYTDSKYITYIKFLDTIDREIVVIESSELEFYSAIEQINYFIMNFPNELDDNIYFTSSCKNNYYMNINTIDNYIELSDDLMNDNAHIFYINIYSSNITENIKHRLYFTLNQNDLIDICTSMYDILEDIPYLNKLHYEFIDSFMGDY